MSKSLKTIKEEEKTQHPTLFGEPMDDLDEEEIDDLVEMPEFDIFEDIGAKLVQSGDSVTYTVKKNGTFQDGALPHPQSWDAMRKRYGGGTIQVTLRSLKKGGYVKGQTRNLAPVEEKEVETREVTPTAANSSNSTELFMLMQQMKREEREENQRQIERMESDRREREERAEREAERKDREATEREEKRVRDEEKKAQEAMSSNTMMMTMMFKMMETQSANNAAMITALLTQPKDKKEDLSLNKIMEMMDARMEKTITMVTGMSKDKKSELSVSEQIKMLNDAEERGFKKARDIERIAEDRAEKMAELRENGGEKPAPTEPSTTKMLIESLVPAVQAIMATRLGGGMPEAPATATAQPAPVMTAQALPAPPARVIGANPVYNRPGSAVSPIRPSYVPQPMQQPMPTVAPNPAPIKTVTPAITKKTEEVSEMSKNDLIEKTTIAEIGKDLAKNLITGNFQPEKTAETCLLLLKPFGVDENYLSSQFTLDAMIDIAKANKMPDAIRPYLVRFHAHITTKATMGTRQSATDQK